MHPDLQPGHMLHNDRYRITKRLDRGGFGVIYLAEDLALRRNEYSSMPSTLANVVKSLSSDQT